MGKRSGMGAAIAGILLGLVLISGVAEARVDLTEITRLTLDSPAVDIAISEDEGMIFVLTGKEMVVYSPASDRIESRVPVEGLFNRITYDSKENTLFLSSARSGTFRVIRLDKVFDIDVSGLPMKGPVKAPVTIAAFDDYQWPYCARLEPVLQQLLQKYPKDVKLVIVLFPLEGHDFSMTASKAALAADMQGKFWEFHREIFGHREQLNDAVIRDIADFLDLDMERFETDRNSAAVSKLIEKGLENASQIGVHGTPVVFINGRAVRRLDMTEMSEMIEEAIKKGK